MLLFYNNIYNNNGHYFTLHIDSQQAIFPFKMYKFLKIDNNIFNKIYIHIYVIVYIYIYNQSKKKDHENAF